MHTNAPAFIHNFQPQPRSNLAKMPHASEGAVKSTRNVAAGDAGLNDDLNLRYDASSISKKREEVREKVLRDSTYLKAGVLEQISGDDLKLIYHCYDQVFLDGRLKEHLKVPLSLSLSSRLSKAAGKTLVRYRQGSKIMLEIEIRIGTGFLFQHHLLKREKLVGGLPARDGLEALMLVMEHELCHVLEYCLYGESRCGRERFIDLSERIFGHTSSHHQLPTDVEIAKKIFGFETGEAVAFEYDDSRIHGVIARINKRATVMVKDPVGSYMDARGIRYTKYYIPLHCLERMR